MRSVNSVVHTEYLVQRWSQEKQKAAATKLYVLLDPSARHPLADEHFVDALLRADANVKISPIFWQHVVLRREHRPFLIAIDPLTNAGSELLACCVDMCVRDFEQLASFQGQRVCGWLLSDQPVPVLQVHLGALAVQVPPQDSAQFGRRRLLRFYDPMVTPVLLDLLTHEQRQVVLGPVLQWLWLDNGPQGLRGTSACQAQSQHIAAQRVQYLLDLAQWETIVALDAFNLSWIERGAKPNDLAQRTSVLNTLARLFHLRGRMGELKQFAHWALEHHSQFDRHPKTQALLKQDPALPALQQLTRAQWQGVREDLNAEIARRSTLHRFNP